MGQPIQSTFLPYQCMVIVYTSNNLSIFKRIDVPTAIPLHSMHHVFIAIVCSPCSPAARSLEVSYHTVGQSWCSPSLWWSIQTSWGSQGGLGRSSTCILNVKKRPKPFAFTNGFSLFFTFRDRFRYSENQRKQLHIKLKPSPNHRPS